VTYYHPQAVASLRILLEDNGASDPTLKQEYNLNITPKSLRVTINDYTKADTFSMELDYKNFPFDPRTIRAVGVSIFIEDQKTLWDTNRQEFKIIEPKSDTPTEASNAIFLGFADDDSIRFDEDDRTVTLEGRDFTALLIDEPYDDRGPISLTTNLENVIAGLLTRLPSTREIKVIVDPKIDDLPTLAQFYPDFNPLAGTRSKRKNETYWDIIQDLARRAGLIIYMELDKLKITKPNALYDPDELKQFVWGKNLRTLSFKRKLGRMKNFNVGVRSLNIEKKEVLEAIIPADASLSWSLTNGVPRKTVTITKLLPNGDKEEKNAPVIMFRIPDIANKEALVAIGESLFEELGRQQIEGTLETNDMCTIEGDVGGSALIPNKRGVEFDITKIRNATPIEISIDQDDISAISKLKSQAERRKYLLARCYEPLTAEVFSKTMGKFGTKFYTRAVDFKFDGTNGFSMSLDFINFIENVDSLIA